MEHILHYVWKHKLFDKNLKTTDGISVEILDVGIHNNDSGPDFLNSKIKIGGETWVGNIEIHQTSDNWYHHKHHENSSYNSVILHIVEHATKDIFNESKRAVPQCEIRYPKRLKENIDFLLHTDTDHPCCNFLRSIPKLHINGWLNSLLLERLERKLNDIELLSDRFNNSWTDVFYILLSRSMGFGINSDAFERLALSLPLNYILKQADSVIQIEALLFGQAGLLDDISDPDGYTCRLKQEYAFLKNKYSLASLDKELFKKMRMRPASSPYIRIAQLSSLLQQIQGLFSKILASNDLGQIRLMLHVNASEYWQTHYCFGETSSRKSKYIGDMALNLMVINVVVPILFFIGKRINDDLYIKRSLSYLEQIQPESNSIIRQFSTYGLLAKNAYDSQALLQLKREYCEKKKCLYCRIGYKLLSEK